MDRSVDKASDGQPAGRAHAAESPAKDGPDLSLGLPDIVGHVVVAIGADLVDIDRIRTTMARQSKFGERVFTPGERAYCDQRNDPAERYAARFAAKEAVLKALGTGLGGADFTDIEVIKLPSGKPELQLSGRAAERSAELGIKGWLITISHSDHLAQVFVAGLGTPPDDGPPPAVESM